MKQVTLWGLGSMGSGIAKLLRRRGIPIAAVWDRDQEKVGTSVGQLLGDGLGNGVFVSQPDENYPPPGNVLIIATGSFVPEVYPQIMEGLYAGQHVLTIAEEMAYPWASHQKLAENIDGAAQAKGVSVLGTGINPGFVLDALIGFLSACCSRVESVYASRVNDLSPFGPTVLKSQGVAVTPQEFADGLEDGTIVGHIGFPESIHLAASMLGWTIDRIEQEREPIISNTKRETPFITVEPGQTAGCRHRAWGYSGGRCVIQLDHPQQVCPDVEGVSTGDHITITGEPSLSMDIQPEIPGGTGTVAVTVNAMEKLFHAPPGLRTMADLVIPSCRQ